MIGSQRYLNDLIDIVQPAMRARYGALVAPLATRYLVELLGLPLAEA